MEGVDVPFRQVRACFSAETITVYQAFAPLIAEEERILSVAISRSDFEWALRHSGLSSHDPAVDSDHHAWLATKQAPVRIQWDPERDIRGQRFEHRSIQIGLSGTAISRYADEWITTITDVTELTRKLADLVAAGRVAPATALLPHERPYPLPTDVATRIGATTPAI